MPHRGCTRQVINGFTHFVFKVLLGTYRREITLGFLEDEEEEDEDDSFRLLVVQADPAAKPHALRSF